MKFAMCNEFCQGWAFDRACRLAADAGYDAIEVAPFTLADSVEDIDGDSRAQIRATAADCGLEIAGLHWLLVKPEGLHLNGPDEDTRRRTVEYLRAEIRFCADVGGRNMIIGSPKQRNVLPGQSYEEAWDGAVEAFADLAGTAEECGVMLCIEPLAPAETNFVATAAEARRLVDAVGHPQFRMMLDVKAMSADEEPVPDVIRHSAGYFEHFHANDANLNGPGFGDTDFRPIVAALRDVGYDGYVSVEVFNFEPGPEAIARESLRYLKEVFD
jgi:sugar phosphate isomerase/epimerase